MLLLGSCRKQPRTGEELSMQTQYFNHGLSIKTPQHTRHDVIVKQEIVCSYR
jgi:hypothetical protein